MDSSALTDLLKHVSHPLPFPSYTLPPTPLLREVCNLTSAHADAGLAPAMVSRFVL